MRRPSLWARSEESAERARAQLDGSARGRRPTWTTLADRAVVVEAVAEDPAVKGDLLGAARRPAAPPTRCWPRPPRRSRSTELADASGRPERFAGCTCSTRWRRWTWWSWPSRDAATEDTRARIHASCASALGKTAVEVPDIPGFVVNRLLFPFLFEAVRLADETGLEPEAVDACMKLAPATRWARSRCSTSSAWTWRWRSASQIGADVPARVRELVEQGQPGPQDRRGLLRVRLRREPGGAVRRPGARPAAPAWRPGPTPRRPRRCPAPAPARPRGPTAARRRAGRPSGRSRAPRGRRVSDGPSSPCALISARTASRCESLSLTHHMARPPEPGTGGDLPVEASAARGRTDRRVRRPRWPRAARARRGGRPRRCPWSRMRTASIRFSRTDSTRSE